METTEKRAAQAVMAEVRRASVDDHGHTDVDVLAAIIQREAVEPVERERDALREILRGIRGSETRPPVSDKDTRTLLLVDPTLLMAMCDEMAKQAGETE